MQLRNTCPRIDNVTPPCRPNLDVHAHVIRFKISDFRDFCFPSILGCWPKLLAFSSAIDMSTETKISPLHAERLVTAERSTLKILFAVSICHLLNDTVQSLLPALYPLFRNTFRLDFGQVGLIAFTATFTSSLLQPLVGLYSDRHPKPYFLAAGMGITLTGLLTLAVSPSYAIVLIAAGLIGTGSAVFHPESSRVARMASGGQHGFAQSIFQVGGNAGSSLGPLLAAFVLSKGQFSIAWFSILALIAMILLFKIGHWARRYRLGQPVATTVPLGIHVTGSVHAHDSRFSSRKIALAMGVLIILMFSKFFYLASLTSYYTFYLMDRFHVSVQSSQVHLFVGGVAADTNRGGPGGHRFGRKFVIWWSILGVLPFSILLPYASLFWTRILSVVIGVILASAFSAILVYAQDLIPSKIGTVSGLFFGLAFGLGGLGAALLGKLADHTSISFVYHVCSFLPALGILTAFLPNLPARRTRES
jgi:MFS transporter, FSR family, fosmidomycin resistance protein